VVADAARALLLLLLVFLCRWPSYLWLEFPRQKPVSRISSPFPVGMLNCTAWFLRCPPSGRTRPDPALRVGVGVVWSWGWTWPWPLLLNQAGAVPPGWCAASPACPWACPLTVMALGWQLDLQRPQRPDQRVIAGPSPAARCPPRLPLPGLAGRVFCRCLEDDAPSWPLLLLAGAGR